MAPWRRLSSLLSRDSSRLFLARRRPGPRARKPDLRVWGEGGPALCKRSQRDNGRAMRAAAPPIPAPLPPRRRGSLDQAHRGPIRGVDQLRPARPGNLGSFRRVPPRRRRSSRGNRPADAATRPHSAFQERGPLDHQRSHHPGPQPLKPWCSKKKLPFSPAVWKRLTRLFLESNTAQMPPAFEHGLVEFFSTFEVKGIQISVGAPPPTRPGSRFSIHPPAGHRPGILRPPQSAAIQPAQGRG